MADKSINEMTAEIRKLNTTMGWRDQPGKTFGDYIALLHTEVAEMTEAWRRWGLEDQTPELSPMVKDGGELDSLVPGVDYQLPKPEGVGSELADVWIRALDTADAIRVRVIPEGMYVIEPWHQNELIARGRIPGPLVSFGDYEAWLHREIDRVWSEPDEFYSLLRAVVTFAERFEFDIPAEYERKMKFNWTREFRHGGKRL